MSILVRDETANLALLTIDNNGNMTFGDGTPIDMATLGGYGIIDSSGQIIHGVGSPNLAFTFGSGTLGYSGGGGASSASITTIPGVQPAVQVDSTYPYDVATWFDNEIQHVHHNALSVRISFLGPGGFAITNMNHGEAATKTQAAAIPDFTGAYAYRWL